MPQLDEYLLPHFGLYRGAFRMTGIPTLEVSNPLLPDFYTRIRGKADLTDTICL